MIDVSYLFFSTSLGGILGYLLKTQIDHRLAISRNIIVIQITGFNKAAAVFRAEFVGEIYGLIKGIETGEGFATKVITEDAIIRHMKAKIIFEPFLPESEILSFNGAWENYKNSPKNYSNFQFSKHPEGSICFDAQYTKEESQYFLDHINKLLEYAKPQ